MSDNPDPSTDYPDEAEPPEMSASLVEEMSKLAIPYYTKIGRFIVGLNGAEAGVKATVGNVLGTSVDATQLIMGSTQIRANWGIYKQVIKDKANIPYVADVFARINDEVNEIYSYRNEVVHGTWWVNSGKKFTISRKMLPFNASSSLDSLDHYLHRIGQFNLRIAFIKQVTALWFWETRHGLNPYEIPELLALLGIWRSKLDRALHELGPAPPKDVGDQPAASSPSPSKKQIAADQRHARRESHNDSDPTRK